MKEESTVPVCGQMEKAECVKQAIGVVRGYVAQCKAAMNATADGKSKPELTNDTGEARTIPWERPGAMSSALVKAWNPDRKEFYPKVCQTVIGLLGDAILEAPGWSETGIVEMLADLLNEPEECAVAYDEMLLNDRHNREWGFVDFKAYWDERREIRERQEEGRAAYERSPERDIREKHPWTQWDREIEHEETQIRREREPEYREWLAKGAKEPPMTDERAEKVRECVAADSFLEIREERLKKASTLEQFDALKSEAITRLMELVEAWPNGWGEYDHTANKDERAMVAEEAWTELRLKWQMKHTKDLHKREFLWDALQKLWIARQDRQYAAEDMRQEARAATRARYAAWAAAEAGQSTETDAPPTGPGPQAPTPTAPTAPTAPVAAATSAPMRPTATDKPTAADVAGQDNPRERFLNTTSSMGAEEMRKSMADAYTGFTPGHTENVGGLVGRVRDWIMETAPYPNGILAFSGALSFVALLASRRYRTTEGICPNIYLMALASSGSGKEHPRKVLKRLAMDAGIKDSIGDRFASAEGIEDALAREPVQLFLIDEASGLLSNLGAQRAVPLQTQINDMLLTVYGESASVHFCRAKANQESRTTIVSPHLSMFGTAVPSLFYRSLSPEMLYSGFFSRLMILDAGGQREGQEGKDVSEVPEDVREQAQRILNPDRERGPGNDLGDIPGGHPEQIVINYTPAAREYLERMRKETDAEWNAAPRDDEALRAILSRRMEQAKKLALIVTVGNGDAATSLATAEWAVTFVQSMDKRKLALAGRYSGAETEFEKLCEVALNTLAKAGGKMPKSALQRVGALRSLDSKKFAALLQTLQDRNEIFYEMLRTKDLGRPAAWVGLLSRKFRDSQEQ